MPLHGKTVWFALVLAVILAPSLALARPGKTEEAAMNRAVARALELYTNKDFDEAAEAIERALASHEHGAREDATAWERLAMVARYVHALCLHEQGDLEGARRAMVGLAAQDLDGEVREKAQAALATLEEKPVEVEIKCQPGITFRLYPDKQKESADRGEWLACASNTSALSRPPGSYVIEWRHGFDSQARHVELALGRAHYYELMVPPHAPKPPTGPPCGTCAPCVGQ